LRKPGNASLADAGRTPARCDGSHFQSVKKIFKFSLVLSNILWINVPMSSYNRVTLVGNLTRQPELRKTKTGAAVTELGIALNRAWTGENGQRQEETTFVDVTVWGRSAENAVQYLDKGRSVLVEGRLQMETWQDKQTGQDRSKLKVVADSVQFLGSSHESNSAGRDDDAGEEREARGGGGGRSDNRGSRHSSEDRDDRDDQGSDPGRSERGERRNRRYEAA